MLFVPGQLLNCDAEMLKLDFKRQNIYSMPLKSCTLFPLPFISTFFYIHKKKVSDLRKFSTSGFRWNLHALRCPEHDLNIFRKSLSACMSPKYCGRCISKINSRKLMKLYIQLHLDIIWC